MPSQSASFVWHFQTYLEKCLGCASGKPWVSTFCSMKLKSGQLVKNQTLFFLFCVVSIVVTCSRLGLSAGFLFHHHSSGIESTEPHSAASMCGCSTSQLHCSFRLLMFARCALLVWKLTLQEPMRPLVVRQWRISLWDFLKAGIDLMDLIQLYFYNISSTWTSIFLFTQ